MCAKKHYYIFTFTVPFKLLKKIENNGNVKICNAVTLWYAFIGDVLLNDVLAWCMACRVEYRIILVWHLEADVEKVM